MVVVEVVVVVVECVVFPLPKFVTTHVVSQTSIDCNNVDNEDGDDDDDVIVVHRRIHVGMTFERYHAVDILYLLIMLETYEKKMDEIQLALLENHR